MAVPQRFRNRSSMGILAQSTVRVSIMTVGMSRFPAQPSMKISHSTTVEQFSTAQERAPSVSVGNFILNTAPHDGGAIWNDSVMTIVDTSFSDSEATGGSGGAIFNSLSGTLTVDRSSFIGNSAGFRGGALRNGGTATIDTSTIYNNVSTSQGGGVVNQRNSQY